MRMSEFVEYHINGDCDCNVNVLKEYAERHNLNTQEKLDLIYFYTLTYSVPSGIELYKSRNFLRTASDRQLEQMKSRIVFQSDRKYVRCLHNFEKSIQDWKTRLDGKAERIIKDISEGSRLKDGTIKYLEEWYFIGRFAAYLFAETFCGLFNQDMPKTVDELQFNQGEVYTAGIFNVFGKDDEAEAVEKNGITKEQEKEAEGYVKQILEAVSAAGGKANIYDIETTLCAYRKHFKGTRYNGYYIDRQLAEINEMKRRGFTATAAELYDIRSEIFPHKILGELNGWNGIRTNLKKYYLEYRKIYSD